MAGCQLYKQDNYQQYYVVESYLVANANLPRVRLSKTEPIRQKYNFQEAAVSDAQVEIRKLNPDSTIAQTYPYRQTENGIYNAIFRATVQSDQLYQLHITTADGQEITATTYVPGAFKTVNQLNDRYTYQSPNQIEITTTTSNYITDRQTYYIFTINAAHPDSSGLTPFYRDLVINNDNDIRNYYVNSSGIINQDNYDLNSDGTITLTVPWLAIAFYDTNDVVANAIDNNMYDFLRSQSVQTGGSTLSPGEIQNIRYNVNGGIGIFGSMASDTNRVIITRPNN
ncbi:MAG TPA: DUF4249 family protein [Balneolaceae bacterium]|nr:DUF4249 family protein [Balneolaceae bacterium]